MWTTNRSIHITEMPNRRTVVKMWQNKGFIKLPKSKHYVKLFLINSTYTLLCEQQIEVSSRRPPNRKRRKWVSDEWLRNYSIEQLSILSNSHAVISKGGGGGVVMLFIREAEGKLQLNDANKRRIVATRWFINDTCKKNLTVLRPGV